MFDWISGKKDNGEFHLSDEAREQLRHIAQSLNHSQSGDPALSAEAVLEQLLCGNLSLVSQSAKGKISLAADEIKYHPQAASSGEEVTAPAPSEETVQPKPSQAPASHVDQTAVTQEHDSSDSGTQIDILQKQIEMLQNRLNQRRDQQAAQQAKISSLLRKTHQQQEEIESLRAQMEQLRQAAAIGEAQLNRWRFNNFSR